MRRNWRRWDSKFDEKSSHGDIALQVYLAAPELLAQKHNEMRLSRLASFEYHGACRTGHHEPEGQGCGQSSSGIITVTGWPNRGVMVHGF